jgi:hypothetical protein
MGCEGCKNPECYLTPDKNYCHAENRRGQATNLQLRRCARGMYVRKIQALSTTPELSPKSPPTPAKDRTRTPAAKQQSLSRRQWQRTKHEE